MCPAVEPQINFLASPQSKFCCLRMLCKLRRPWQKKRLHCNGQYCPDREGCCSNQKHTGSLLLCQCIFVSNRAISTSVDHGAQNGTSPSFVCTSDYAFSRCTTNLAPACRIAYRCLKSRAQSTTQVDLEQSSKLSDTAYSICSQAKNRHCNQPCTACMVTAYYLA